MSKEISLKTISSSVTFCSRCNNCFDGQRHYPGIGNANTLIMIVCSGPTKLVDKDGDHYAGMYGALIRKILSHAKMTLRDVYHTYSVKCYTGNLRSIDQLMMNACSSHLRKLIGIIKPKLIITFGLGAYFSITNSRNAVFNLPKATSVGCVLYINGYQNTKHNTVVLPILSSSLLIKLLNSLQRKNAAMAIIRLIKNLNIGIQNAI